MKLIDVQELHPPFDVPSGMAAGLLAGPEPKFKQYIPPSDDKPKKQQDLSWAAKPGARVEGIWDSPYIVCHCKTCGDTAIFTGSTCHRTQIQRCCGGSSKVPEHIAAEYAALRKAWEPKHKKYRESVRRNEAERERIRKAANEEENRILATKLRLQSTPSHELVK